MVNGTDSAMNLNEVGEKLAANRGFNLCSIFSERGRGLVELIGENASELWDVGKYEIDGISNTTKLTQSDDSPHMLAAYEGRLPRDRYERFKLLNKYFKEATK